MLESVRRISAKTLSHINVTSSPHSLVGKTAPSAGESAGTSSTAGASAKRRKERPERLSERILQMQKKIWIILTASEIILIGIVLTQFLVFQHIVFEALAFKTQSELGLMEKVEFNVRPDLFVSTPAK